MSCIQTQRDRLMRTDLGEQWLQWDNGKWKHDASQGKGGTLRDDQPYWRVQDWAVPWVWLAE